MVSLPDLSGEVDNRHVRIRAFDSASLSYVSYYLSGLSQVARKVGIGLDYAQLPENHPLHKPLKEQPALALFEFEDDSERFLFCIDGYDDPDYYNDEALHACRYYFKINRRPTAPRGNVLPINPCFPIRPPMGALTRLNCRYGLLSGISRSSRRQSTLRYWADNRSLAWFRQQRQLPTEHDVHLVLPFYADRHDQCNERRLRVVESLAGESAIRSFVGFYSPNGKELPGAFRRYQLPKVSKVEHLRAIAASKIAVYVPGVDDCFSFKFGEQLSIGAAIVGYQLYDGGHRLLVNEEMRQQFSHSEPEDIIEGVLDLLAQPDRIEKLSAHNAQLFDSMLSPAATAGELLRALCNQPRSASSIHSTLSPESILL